MAQRSVRLPLHRLFPIALLASLACALPGCWGGSSLGRLFGAPGDGGGGGFDPGVGGGLTLRDLFVNARLQRAAPSLVSLAPGDGTNDVSLKTPIAILFSESMFESTVLQGVSLFQSGSTTATASTITMFQGDTLAVLVPTADLLPDTQYDVVIAGSVTDLQGEAIENTGGGTDIRFSFNTIVSTGDPDFEVIFSSPSQQEGEVPRGSEALLVFSEPIDVSTTGGGINAPGNLVVTRNGATLVSGVDYTLSTLPATNPRGVRVVFASLPPADADVQVLVDKDVKSADGQEAIANGNGFQLDYTTQDSQVPIDIAFPQSSGVSGADGAIGATSIHAFQANVSLTNDGQLPETTTILYFDKVQQNGLLFENDSSNPTPFVSDLEPVSTPALLDGDVFVGAYVERRGFVSEVTLIETLRKDTVGPRLIALGPPAIPGGVLLTRVNDPVLHGNMSEPCAGVQVDFDGAGTPDFNSVQFAVGQSTVTNDFFVTGATEDAPLPRQLEPVPSFAIISSDVLGNVSVNLDFIAHQTVGIAGATVAAPDGVSALWVTAFAGDTFQPFTSGAVALLDAFPPDPAGVGQIMKGFSASLGVVRFTDAELASIATAQVTVTIIGERAGTSGGAVVFGPLSIAGLDKPTAASPRAVIAVLDPAPPIDLNNLMQCDITNESTASPTETGSAFAVDVDPATQQLEKTDALVPNPGLSDNLFDLPLNQLETFAVVEQFNFGGTQFRFTSSEPFTTLPPTGSFGPDNVKTADFLGRTSYSSAANPVLVHTVTFNNASASAGGAVGLLGTESPAEQLRELRIACREPGFVDNVVVGSTQTFAVAGGNRTGTVLLPRSFLDNDTATAPGVGAEDTSLELLLQPALIDPAAVVDLVPLQRNLRLELLVQDKLVAGTTTPASGYSRARALFNPGAPSADTLTLQPVPDVTATDLSQPPELSWPEVTQGEGMHCLALESGLASQTWRIYVPAQSGGGTVTMQVPFLPAALDDNVGPCDFQFPGTFAVFVESYDFDPNHVFGPGTPEQYDFNPQQWFVTDLERECINSSRSDTNVTITTN